MTDQPVVGNREFAHLRLSGWIISACIHGFALFLATSFLAKVTLAPSTTPFQWNVAVVHPPEAPASTSASSTPAVPAATRPKPSARKEIPMPARPTGPPVASAQRPSSRDAVSADPPRPIESADLAPAPPPHVEPFRSESAAVAAPQSTGVPEPPKQDVESTLHPQPSLSEPQPPTPVREETAAPPTPNTPPAQSATAPPESEPPATSVAAVAPPTVQAPPTRKPDLGWLAGSILQRIEPFKRYPAAARIEKLEGRVVVRAVILADGQLASSDIAKSSGHDILDQAALEAVRQAAPFVLTQQLGRERVTIHIPLSYTLGR